MPKYNRTTLERHPVRQTKVLVLNICQSYRGFDIQLKELYVQLIVVVLNLEIVRINLDAYTQEASL